MSMNDDFDASSLMPQFRREVHFSVRTVADVIFLGQLTIETMIREWEFYIAEKLDPEIEEQNRELQRLVGKVEDWAVLHRTRHERALGRLNHNKKAALRDVEVLKALKERSEKKPAMPNLRPDNWFGEDDPVVCYIGEWKDRMVSDTFVTGTVHSITFGSFGPHAGDNPFGGTVNVDLDTPILRKRHPDELWNGASYRVRHPKVLHPWEFKYLQEHPDFARIWAEGGSPSNIGNYEVECLHFGSEQFLRALEEAARGKSQ